MAKVTGGEAIVKSLVTHGVDTIFGLPGVQNDYFFNALYDENKHNPTQQIRVINARHEQGVAYMALGYALSTGKVGVYSVVPGPGLLNTTAALATAYSLRARVLCLTGQIRSDQIGRGFGMLHEIPQQLEIIKSLTKWAARITTPAEAPHLVNEAFSQLLSGWPQPVGLEVPPDVLAKQTEVDLTPLSPERRFPPVDIDVVNTAAELLGKAKYPMIFVGSGAIEAAEAVKHLAEVLQAPVVSMRSGKGILDRRHPLSLNPLEAHALWPQVDVALGVGTRLQAPQSQWGLDDAVKVIHINLDPQEPKRYKKPDLVINAHSKDALQALIPAVERHNSVRPSREAELMDLRTEFEDKLDSIQPQVSFIKAMRAVLPDDGLFVNEFTQVGYVSRIAFPVYQPRAFISPGYQGTLGYGFATALGVQVANPAKAVLSIVGDGGFMFTMPELATAVQYKINTVTVVFNDGAYGNVLRMQKENYQGRVIASQLQNPNFVKLAEAFGAQGLRAETPEALQQALAQGFAYTEGPTLIEVTFGEVPAPWSQLSMGKVRGK